MLKQALDYQKLLEHDSYKEYIECLQTIKQAKRGTHFIDFTKDYFDTAEGSRRIFFPKYKVINDNPFIPIVFGNESHVVIEKLPVIQYLESDSKSKANVKTNTKSKTKVKSPKPKSGHRETSEKFAKQDNSGNHDKMPRHVFEAMKNQIPFITSAECKSSKRSDPHHISKAALIEVITKNKNFAQYFPKGYRNLSKEKLCDVIFNV